MSDKVRRIDWSPDEWLSGTRGLLSPFELAVYDVVLNLIYSRGQAAPDDPAFIYGHFKRDRNLARQVQQTRLALDRLITLGKLRVQTDHGGRWLLNGRAEAELGKARGRITAAARAGIASGAARRAARDQQRLDTGSTSARHRLDAKSSGDNGLARTSVRNHQPPKNLTVTTSGTDPAREAGTVTDGGPGPAPGPVVATQIATSLIELARRHREKTADKTLTKSEAALDTERRLEALARKHRGG